MMPTSEVLQHLYSFNTFSPEFSRCLDSLIQSDEEDHYLSSLQGPELTRLVDFLDRVRVLPSASFLPAYEKTLQALGIVPVTEDVSRRCLNKLQALCSHHGVLPSSHIISGGLVKAGDCAIAATNLSDVWEGTFNGAKVCIKSPRITLRDRQEIEKVSNRHTDSYLLKYTCWCVGILQGGDHVEKLEASKYRSLHRRHARSLTICVRVDAERRLDRLPRQKPGRESHCFSESRL